MTVDNSTFVAHVSLPDLGTGAGLAIWGLRAIILGHGECPALSHGLARAFSDDSEAVQSALLAFVQSIGTSGRRKILLSPPGCGRLTSDELSIAACLAAAQQGRTDLVGAHLSWLLAGPAALFAHEAARQIADIFLAHGLTIRPPELEIGAAPEEWPNHPTVVATSASLN